MVQNYYDMTGVLALNQVTPVITALFGAFNLDASTPGNGQAYIARIAEDTDASWDAVADNLAGLVAELELALPADADESIEEYLYALASHFVADASTELLNLIENHGFEDNADLDTLFVLAQHFDDGHGLTAIATEGAWHCSEPLLFEFGGAGEYISRHVHLSNSSQAPRTLGPELDAAIEVKDLDQAAACILAKVNDLLMRVVCPDVQAALRTKLSAGLAAQ